MVHKLDELEFMFWIGQKCAKAWKELGIRLRHNGWTWQTFSRLVKLKRTEIILLQLKEITWEEYLQRILKASYIWSDLLLK